MIYQIEMGAVEQNIIKQSKQAGLPLPDRIANAPVLRLDLAMYLNAFFELDASRQVGMEVGKIPWHIMIEYARYHALSEEQTDNLVYFVKALDTAFIKHHRENK